MQSKALLIPLTVALLLTASSEVRAEGAQFFDLFFDTIFIPDVDGDLCQSTLIPPDFGSSFVRINPNGKITVHYAAHPANVYFQTATGEEFTGVGQATANGCVEGCSWATFHITAQVISSDGTETKQAVCNGTFANDSLVQIDASLH